jgi:hypothetical protein
MGDYYLMRGNNELGLSYLFEQSIKKIKPEEGEIILALECVYGEPIERFWLDKYFDVSDINNILN